MAPTWRADELPRRLAAADLDEVVWAAHLVTRDRVRGAVPAVRQALARLVGRSGFDGELARLHLLDALIQLEVKVPGEELLPHTSAACLRVPALLLAAKGGAANSRYFATRFAELASAPDLEWQACGDQLAALREPHFVAGCLWQVEFALCVEVVGGGPAPSAGFG